jgi:hypothetical protein
MEELESAEIIEVIKCALQSRLGWMAVTAFAFNFVTFYSTTASVGQAYILFFVPKRQT